jgi:hypothetical protein
VESGLTACVCASQDKLVSKDDSPSYIAEYHFTLAGLGRPQYTVVFAQSTSGGDVIADGYVEHVWSQLQRLYSYYPSTSYFTVRNGSTLPDQLPVVLAEPLFLTSDRSSTILLFPYYNFLTPDLEEALSWVHTRTEDYWIGVASIDALGDTDSSGAKNSLAKMDAVSIPIALLVLAWRVRSLPLLIIPLLALIVSLLTSFALLDAFSTSIKFPSFSPALFISTSVAICFDWSLFLLGR